MNKIEWRSRKINKLFSFYYGRPPSRKYLYFFRNKKVNRITQLAHFFFFFLEKSGAIRSTVEQNISITAIPLVGFRYFTSILYDLRPVESVGDAGPTKYTKLFVHVLLLHIHTYTYLLYIFYTCMCV